MKISECNHIRIRGTETCNIDIEQFIKSIETQYKIDFRTIPQWKEVVKHIQETTTNCKRKVFQANRRKNFIIKNILTQSTRMSPFEMTACLARTCDKWSKIQNLSKQKNRTLNTPQTSIYKLRTEDTEDETSDNTSTAHPNTEIIEPEIIAIDNTTKSDMSRTENKVEPDVESHLPAMIYTNQHRPISPLRSQDIIDFNFVSVESKLFKTNKSEQQLNEWQTLKQTSKVLCFPKKITVSDKSLGEQSIAFSIQNCGTEYIYIRFICFTNVTPFAKAKIVPQIPKKIYPGIAHHLKLAFKLRSTEEFVSVLYFKVGMRIFKGAPPESLCIPVVSNFNLHRNVLMPDAIYITPNYLWQMRCSSYPFATVQVSNNDNCAYHLHIIKRNVNILSDGVDSICSIEVMTPNTDSLVEKLEDSDITNQSQILAEPKVQIEDMVINMNDIISMVVDDILEIALDTFIFDHKYLLVMPESKVKVDLFFTKASHIGSHHCYYNFEFYDKDSEDIVITKTLKVFAEVLPHPIIIYPKILDLSISPIIHGYCKDSFVVYNTHKILPVTIKVKLTSKMKKLFRVNPMEIFIPAQMNYKFNVILCSNNVQRNDNDYLAHFTFKIVVIGDKSVYKDVPPFFYEIIVPCAFDFMNVYKNNYFKNEDDDENA